MKSNLLFDFIIDKTSQTVTIDREFAAELPSVWDAFTVPELLDQWWAPKPWESRTKLIEDGQADRIREYEKKIAN